ncbi:MAG: endolytic transglycosylase MltG [Clostridiales bacterium]|nr:endolytic transglycosylase MltG [Clostridiales bacterium]
MKKRILCFAVLLVFCVSLFGCQISKKNEEPNVAPTVRVTLPEGYTLVKMAWAFEEAGLFSTQEFLDAAKSYDFSKYDFLADSVNEINICFKLEGYLSPNTYEFYVGDTPEQVITKLLDQRKDELTDAVKNRAKELNMTIHQVLTLASLIEKETYNSEDKAKVSSVFHNRLNADAKSGNPTRLQTNTTDNYAKYVIGVVYPDSVEYYEKFYNTYTCVGLPIGPICNPSLSSIMAALYPDDTDYYYFAITQNDSKYAKDYETHKANCKALGLSNY